MGERNDTSAETGSEIIPAAKRELSASLDEYGSAFTCASGYGIRLEDDWRLDFWIYRGWDGQVVPGEEFEVTAPMLHALGQVSEDLKGSQAGRELTHLHEVLTVAAEEARAGS